MYQVSQLMSTPVANSSRSDRGLPGELSRTCIFPRWRQILRMLLHRPLTGSHYVCRRSPRLLTNGYYIWTEDSFLCDPDGHITLNPSHTSVIYKENLVRIFRKKKRTHRSLSSLLDPRASKSWLHGSIFGDGELPPSEDMWLEGLRGLDSYHCSENGGDPDCSLSDGLEPQMLMTDTPEGSSSVHVLYRPLQESSQHSLQSQMKESEYFQENVLVHSKTSLMHKVSFQAVLLAVCLIISVCARNLPPRSRVRGDKWSPAVERDEQPHFRWLMGGELVNVFTWPLMITIVYAVNSLFLNLASYLKATACAGP